MSDQKPVKSGMIWFGLFSMSMGLIPILSAADIILTDESSFNAPRWVVSLAGFVFISAGISVTLMDPIFDAIREKWWFTYLNHLGWYGVLLCMVIILNWVAFGPGERQFSGGISIPFITIWTDRASEWSGRVVFALSALLMDIILLWGVANTIWKTLRGNIDN